MNRLIKLSNGLEVEVELMEGEISEISSHGCVESPIEKISALLSEVTKPVTSAFSTLSEEVSIESTKITVGVKFGVSGNVFVAKSSAEANITIEMTVRPKND